MLVPCFQEQLSSFGKVYVTHVVSQRIMRYPKEDWFVDCCGQSGGQRHCIGFDYACFERQEVTNCPLGFPETVQYTKHVCLCGPVCACARMCVYLSLHVCICTWELFMVEMLEVRVGTDKDSYLLFKNGSILVELWPEEWARSRARTWEYPNCIRIVHVPDGKNHWRSWEEDGNEAVDW